MGGEENETKEREERVSERQEWEKKGEGKYINKSTKASILTL
jgi:hypothetical protein